MRRRAFSLTEILVALVILGLAAGLVATSLWDAVPGANLERSAWQVADVVALVRQSAIVDGDYYTVEIDLDAGRLQAWNSSGANDASSGAQFELPSGIVVREVRCGGLCSTQGTARLMITPTGVATPFAMVIGGPTGTLRVVSDGLSEEVLPREP